MFNQDYKEIISLLLEEKADFLIIGAYAMAAHGFPRATGDIDIFIKFSVDFDRVTCTPLKLNGLYI